MILASSAVADMMARYLDAHVMAALDDDDVTEIYVNPHDYRIRHDTRSRGKVVTEHQLDVYRVEMFLNAVASMNHTTLGPENPSLQAELPRELFRGSRLQGFVAPLAAGPSFVIRKPPRLVYSLDHYVHRGMLSEVGRIALREAIVRHENVLIAGGTNSGKTTFANAMIKEMANVFPYERIVLLEDTLELQCDAPDHVALRTTPQLSLAQLVKVTLRASPSRIVVGEVRDSSALDLLDAWATGHPGGCATFHATDPQGALHRLDRLAQRANVPSQLALISEAVDYVVMLGGGNVDRRVTDIVRVEGLDRQGRFVLHYLNDQGEWI